MTTYEIAESGKNGSVTITPTGLQRVLAKRLGKDDAQFIPLSSISWVQHDRKTIGKDVVKVAVSGHEFEWRMKRDADEFAAALSRMLAER